MKYSTLLALSLGALVVTGCQQVGNMTAGMDYSTGTEISAAKMQTFEDGKSTKEDVIAQVGHPGNKSEVSGVEIWSYSYSFIPAMPGTGKKNKSESTVFEFDKKGILIRHYKTNGGGQSDNALLDAANM